MSGIEWPLAGPQPIAIDSRGLGLEAQPSGIHSKLGKSCSLTIKTELKLIKTGNRVLQTVSVISSKVGAPQAIAIDSLGLGLEAQPSGIHSKLGKSCSLTIKTD